MFPGRNETSWSDILLRDELLHAGIRHCRTPLRPLPPDDPPSRIVLAALEADTRTEAQP